MKALIDGDILLYRAGYAAQSYLYYFVQGSRITKFENKTKMQVIQWLKKNNITKEDGKLKRKIIPEPIENACHSMKLMIHEILQNTQSDDHQIYVTSTDKSNYRFDIAMHVPYKGNRTQPKPYHYKDLKTYLMEHWGAKEISGKEADDELGIQQVKNLTKDLYGTKKSIQDVKLSELYGYLDQTVIVTIDKDLDMIPGKHYNLVTKELYTTDYLGYLELYKDRRKIRGGGVKWFYAQMLMGDNADNIKGLPGFGPVRTYEALSEAKTEKQCWDKVKYYYRKKDAIERLMENVDLLWIQQYEGQRKSEELCDR